MQERYVIFNEPHIEGITLEPMHEDNQMNAFVVLSLIGFFYLLLSAEAWFGFREDILL